MAKGKTPRQGRAKAPHSLTSTLRSRSLLPSSPLPFDLRSMQFEPDHSPARLRSGGAARVIVDPPRRKSPKSDFSHVQLAFAVPGETMVCVRRHQRREVLHALKKTGKRGQRRPRRSKWRTVKC